MSWGGPNYDKLKTNLRLVINRLKLLEKKKTELAMKSRKEIADYLSASKVDRARIRVEHIIREDYMVEAMEMVEMYCDLLLARMGLIKQCTVLEDGLEQPIASVIWSSYRLQSDVPELKVVVDQLRRKYGKEFVESCQTNELNNVNDKLMHKLGVEAPPKHLIEMYLEEIAKSYNVPFTPDPGAVEIDSNLTMQNLLGDDFDKPGAGMPVMNPEPYPNRPPPPAGFIAAPPPAHEMYPPPPIPSLPPVGPVASGGPTAPANIGNSGNSVDSKAAEAGFLPGFPELPSVPDSMPTGNTGSSNDVDFDDLTRRFEEPKKKKVPTATLR